MKWQPSQRGSVSVEAAFLIPIWILLVLGILEGGRAWFTYNMLTHAVREGARLASVRPALEQNDPAVIDRIDAVLAVAGLRASQAEVRFTPPLRVTRTIRVSVQVDFRPMVVTLWTKEADFTLPLKARFQTRYEL